MLRLLEMAGLDATEWSWGTVFMDVDLDGWDDVLVANGRIIMICWTGMRPLQPWWPCVRLPKAGSPKPF